MIRNISQAGVKIAAVILAVAAIGGGTVYAGSAVAKNNLLDAEEAENFAILDADVDRDDVTGIQSRLEKENGQYVYDIEFYVGDMKYEYDILAADGSVLEKEIEKENRKSSVTGQTDTSAGQNSPGTDEQQTADDRNTADVTDSSEAPQDQQTDAAPAREQADRENANASGGTGPYISLEQAKQIALEHAGLTAEEVRFTTAKFEDDGDEEEFEIEFYVDQVEYEFEIDAVTGQILDYSKEDDDD